MARPTRAEVVATLLARSPRTYAEEVGIRRVDTPGGLFKVLVMSLLMSARIRAGAAVSGTAALFDRGWTTAARMADSTWEQRTRVLNRSGYARYDESTARMLADTAALILDRYHGDLRRLRDAADREPAAERRLLRECKGIGEVGCDIFFREVQPAWDELWPFVDRRNLAQPRGSSVFPTIRVAWRGSCRRTISSASSTRWSASASTGPRTTSWSPPADPGPRRQAPVTVSQCHEKPRNHGPVITKRPRAGVPDGAAPR